MSAIQLPESVSTFLDILQQYLGLLDRHAEFVSRVDGVQTLWTYRVNGVVPETNIMIHQTQESLESGAPRFRVRIGATIDGEQGSLLHGIESIANRYCMLGALMAHSNQTFTVGSQFIIGDGNLHTCAALSAAAAVNGVASLLGAFSRSSSGEKPHVQQLSSWSQLDFERLQYEFAHLGDCRASDRECQVRTMWGDIGLSAVHNNPYWGGGLLVLVSTEIDRLGIEGSAPVNEMNLIEWLSGDVPMFGGWSADGKYVRFVSFLPNFMKEVDQLMGHIVSWGRGRLVGAADTVAAAIEMRALLDNK